MFNFYVGVNKKIDKLEHHNLFFDEDIDVHTNEIYVTKQWPKSLFFMLVVPLKLILVLHLRIKKIFSFLFQ